jgi:2'-5' RNA ligase
MTTSSNNNNNHNNPVEEEEDDYYDKSKFDHVFSGWSVWIEPEVTPALEETMEYLSTACGGEACGVAPIVPHVTLLYNLEESYLEDADPQELLAKCWEQFQANHRTLVPVVSHTTNLPTHHHTRKESEPHAEEDSEMSQSSFTTSGDDKLRSTTGGTERSVTPYDWYYHHYPKSADDGNGFGCSIALLLMEPSRWLQDLQEACQEILGPDERTKFIPHLSLVYAPEAREAFLTRYIQEQQEVVPKSNSFVGQAFRVKYLSLWSTQGRIHDWYRIAKLPL